MERNTQPDFLELLRLLNERGVEYLIVGGYALAFHGAPRFTADIDLFYRLTPENAERIMQVLQDFGFGESGITLEDLLSPGRIVVLGRPPARVDLMNCISGVEWDDAYANRAAGHYGRLPVNYIGRREFLANKRATGRKSDAADVERLRGPGVKEGEE